MSGHGGTGKWAQPGVPHRGWECVSISDLGELGAICGMCETQEIRYVHHMEHPEYTHGRLAVGCICAGNMEGNRENAERRERGLKAIEGRRKRWLSRNWKESRKGNDYLKTGIYILTVFQFEQGWKGAISVQSDYVLESGFTGRVGQLVHPTKDAAKMALFEQLIYRENNDR